MDSHHRTRTFTAESCPRTCTVQMVHMCTHEFGINRRRAGHEQQPPPPGKNNNTKRLKKEKKNV